MQITNPNLVYTIIFEHITSHRVQPASAALFLDQFFKKKDRTNMLIKHFDSKRAKQESE